MKKYNGLPKATYYRRLKLWTKTLYDAEGNAYYVSPKHIMLKEPKPEGDAHKQLEIE